MRNDDEAFWECLVEGDYQVILVAEQVKAGIYNETSIQNEMVPAMPVLTLGDDEVQRHRQRSASREIFEAAVVARKVGRTEMMDVEKARLAMIKEWATMHQRVWDVSKVREKADVIREAKERGATVQFGRVHGICVKKNAELPEEHVNRKYKGRVVFLGNRVLNQDNDDAIFEELGKAPANLESETCRLLRDVPRQRIASGRCSTSVLAGKNARRRVLDRASTRCTTWPLVGTESPSRRRALQCQKDLEYKDGTRCSYGMYSLRTS